MIWLFVLIIQVLATSLPLEKRGPREVPGVPPLTKAQLQTMRGSCNDYVWFKCPPRYGLPSSSGFGNCCNGSTYCPIIADECTGAESCCQKGFPNYCRIPGGKSWCCSEGYSICGSDGTCLKGGCECTGCIGPNPCQFGIGCSDCEACCANYIPAICKGWGCSGGSVAARNRRATDQCP